MTKMTKNNTISVQGNEIAVLRADAEDYISLTDIAKYRALLIRQGLSQSERLALLNKTAIAQMTSLNGDSRIRELAGGE
jgi:hypothetical protein